MKESEDLTINVTLGWRNFSITIKRAEEEAYLAAASLINRQYNRFASQYPSQDNETYLCMAALSIALSLQQSEARNDTQPFVESIKRMLHTMEGILGQEAQ